MVFLWWSHIIHVFFAHELQSNSEREVKNRLNYFFKDINTVTKITPPLSSALVTEGGGEVAEGYRSPFHITQLQKVCTANITLSM